MLREFNNKPQTRLACRIEDGGTLEKVKKGIWKYTNQLKGCTKVELEFQVGATQEDPVVGDYIVYLDANDIYLCDKEKWEASWNPKGMVLG